MVKFLNTLCLLVQIGFLTFELVQIKSIGFGYFNSSNGWNYVDMLNVFMYFYYFCNRWTYSDKSMVPEFPDDIGERETQIPL